MKITGDRVEVTGTLVFDETVDMRIHAEAHGLILNNLIKMYANPYIAALREYTSNAWDSHLLAGCNRAVEVIFPSELSPNLIIEDWGVGMSRAELAQYGQFGLSSKRDTNDEIGGFGLGSKSGLAMASQFTVTAIKDGKKNTAVIGRKANGAPQMGLMDETDTDKPNGVKITIPASEIEKFTKAVERHMFIGWEPDSIKINSKPASALSVYDTTRFTENADGTGWTYVATDQLRLGTSSDKGLALIGPVSYTLDYSEAGLMNDVATTLRSNLLSNIVFKLDNGEVDLTPSRESLMYTVRTRAHIRAKVEAVIAEARKDYEAKIEATPTRRDALKMVVEAESAGFVGPFTWHGETAVVTASTGDTDSTVTDANVNRDDDTIIGYRVDKDTTAETHFLSYRQRDLLRLEGRWQNLLVTGASPIKEVRKRFLHPDAQSAAIYAVEHAAGVPADENGNRTTAGNYHIYYTSVPLAEISPWFTALFTEVVSAEDYKAVVSKARKEAAAERKLDMVNNKPKTEDMQVRVMRYQSGGKSYDNTRSIAAVFDDLTDDTKVVLLKNGSEGITDTVRQVFTLKNAQYDHRELAAFLQTVANSKRYVFLLANKNIKTDAYAEILPMITVEEMIEAEVRGAASSFTPTELVALQDRGNNDFSWARSLGQRWIEEIHNEETRTWITEIRNEDSAARFAWYEKAARIAKLYKIAEDALDTDTLKVSTKSPGLRYNLLNDMYGGGKPEHIVRYVNLIDQDDARLAVLAEEARKAAEKAEIDAAIAVMESEGAWAA